MEGLGWGVSDWGRGGSEEIVFVSAMCVGNCDNGCYCPAGSSDKCELDCPKGYYCKNAAGPYPIACAAGQYGSLTGMLNAACSGSCAAGRFVTLLQLSCCLRMC
jgi:hypothetical protein